MPSSNCVLVESIYSAIARGDGPAAFGAFDPAIVWNEAEGFPYADGNPYVGPVAVAEGIFQRLATEWDHFQALPGEFLDAGGTVVVTGRYRATNKATGIVVNAQFAHIWRLRGGRVIAFQQYTDTAQLARALNA